ncbi:MAG: anti-sigma factor antagonist [Rhizobiaceae bacterium]|nr:MAG: anti-sigma factor antagonist [Rhizobiaceae bacterium]
MTQSTNPDSACSSPFRLTVVEQPAHHLIELAGMLGLEAAAPLRDEARCLVQSRKNVAIDWSAAEHVGASALQVLLALQKSLEADGRKLSVAADNASVRRYLELAGLSGYFRQEGGQDAIVENRSDCR